MVGTHCTILHRPVDDKKEHVMERRHFSERELEQIFVDVWCPLIKDEVSTRRSFYKLKAWMGPRFWKLLLDLLYTPRQVDHLMNVLYRAYTHPAQRPEKILGDMLARGCEIHSDIVEPAEHPHLKNNNEPKLEREGNVIRVFFGHGIEATDISGE